MLAQRLIYSLLLSAFCGSLAFAQTVKSVPYKDGSHPYLVTDQIKTPKAMLVMFTGGEGSLNLLRKNALSGPNVLIRMRASLEANGVKLLYIDIPTVNDFSRSSEAYAQSVMRIIDQEKPSGTPVFVAGISRGTISAANLAARSSTAGLILLSAVTGGTHDGTVRDVPVELITAPSLLILHRQDGCVSSRSEAALRTLANQMNKSSSTVLLLAGGNDEGEGTRRAAACHPKSFHGFNGIDDLLASHIFLWIESKI